MADLPSVQAELYADGTLKSTTELSDANNWEYVFKNLPIYDEKTGAEIKYEIKEVPVENYEMTLETAEDGTVTITNKEIVKPTKPTPKPTKKGNSPKTGDPNGLSTYAFYFGMMLLAAAMAAVIRRRCVKLSDSSK